MSPLMQKTVIAMTVHINLDSTGAVTHAWQDTLFSVTEDGVEITRQNAAGENIDPDRLSAALPATAALLRQINDGKVAAAAVADQAAQDAGEKLAQLKALSDELAASQAAAKAAAEQAARDAGERLAQLNALTDELAAARSAARLAADQAEQAAVARQAELKTLSDELAAARAQLAEPQK